MLQNTTELYGHKLVAMDGDIGHVKDFYFDDTSWAIRYLVVDTGSWLTGRPVLLSPQTLGKLDEYENTLQVKLHKKQIQNSPTVGSRKPLVGETENGCYRYFGWPAYWEEDAGELENPPVNRPTLSEKAEIRIPYRHLGDKHLQSTQTVTDYRIQTVDGVIGSVNGFMVDDRSWIIRELIVETGRWFSAKEILVSPSQIKQINYATNSVMVNLTKTDILSTPRNQLAQAGAEKLSA